MAISQNDARQLNKFAAIPPKIVPNTKPSGLPAEKHANAAFFLFEGFSYALPRIPEAGGTELADINPIMPVRTSRLIGVFAKPAASAKIANSKNEPTSNVFRPLKC